MKKFILGFLMLFVLCGATASSFADGGPIPMCNPNCDCRPGRTNPCTPDKTPRPYVIENVGFNY